MKKKVITSFSKISLLLLFCFLSGSLIAREINIGLFYHLNVKKAIIKPLTGKLHLNEAKFNASHHSNSLHLSILGNKVLVKSGSNFQTTFDTLTVRTDNYWKGTILQTQIPSSLERRYNGNFKVFVNAKGYLTIVNLIEIEDYLKGVVESEGGFRKPLEYYKVQAVISRTYALSQWEKHTKKEGFNLCDQVHCQAFKRSLQYNVLINQAVVTTQDEILVDENYLPINALFHANCGGQTIETHNVWTNNINYLKSFVDTFCLAEKNATWVKKIPKAKWFYYLEKNFNFPVSDSTHRMFVLNFKQPYRKYYLGSAIYGIPLTKIRNDWRLKSTFFEIKEEGNLIVLTGKGYGHGVGLCQQGSIKMGHSGYDYRHILGYYYPKSKILSLGQILIYNAKLDQKTHNEEEW